MVSHELRGPISTIRGIAATHNAHYFDRLARRREGRVPGADRAGVRSHARDGRPGVAGDEAWRPAGSRRRSGPTELAAIGGQGIEDAGLGDDRTDRARARRGHDRRGPDEARRGRAPGRAERRRLLPARGRTDRGLAHEGGADAVLTVVDQGPGMPEDRREARVHDVPELAAGGLRGGSRDRPRDSSSPGPGCRTPGVRYPSRASRAGVRCSASGCRRKGPHVGEGDTVTLLICDDHKILTDALATVVGLDDGLEPMVADPCTTPRPRSRSAASSSPTSC